MDGYLDCLPVQVGPSERSQIAYPGTWLVSEPDRGRGRAETGLKLVVQSFGHPQLYSMLLRTHSRGHNATQDCIHQPQCSHVLILECTHTHTAKIGPAGY